MDLSQIQSGSKCSSDFSIERILSDDSRKEASAEVPSWLCCTRYQPPRIPRASSSASRARRSGRHARVPFTPAQAAALEAAYARAPYLAPPALRSLAAALQLRDDRIKIWFQNRRARDRREKSTKISPPHAVTLPPTTMPHGGLNPRHWTPTNVSFEDNTRLDEDIVDTTNILHVFPKMCYGRQSSKESDGNSAENRPETPLDIETIED